MGVTSEGWWRKGWVLHLGVVDGWMGEGFDDG